MNSVELRKELINMMQEAFKNGTITGNKNQHPSYYVAVIDCIIKYYNNTKNYFEENAIATFKGFLESGVLTW